MEQKWNVRFEEWDFEWSHHDTETDSVKFYVEHDGSLTEADKRRITDAMTKAAAVELLHIYEEKKSQGRTRTQSE